MKIVEFRNGIQARQIEEKGPFKDGSRLLRIDVPDHGVVLQKYDRDAQAMGLDTDSWDILDIKDTQEGAK